MANEIPVPRSYSEILGDQIDAFLSNYGLRALKIGSPVLSMLESAAQSDLRASEDVFNLLEAVSLDQARGLALDRIGADESVPRQTESPASGAVTISDTSFTKISTKVFQGLAAPIVGTTSLNVTDAEAFPASGSVYIGRGTDNIEGPLAYTSKTDNGDYWTLTLSSGTQRFHNLGEGVVLAQGGNRDINAGTLVQTPQGNVVDAVQYKLLYTARIPDGEVEVTGVAVTALKPGTIGNIGDGAINSFVTSPFNGAAVTNPLPYTNGLATETDDAYRARIRQARQSRVRGTALALQTFSIGVTALDENKRVLSASVIARQDEPTLLVVDDGTGYEERAEGVPLESFVDEAVGGELYFKTSERPVAKAFLLSTQVAPFALVAGQKLQISVGGVVTVHTFNDDEFRNIGNASAYEVTASVNGDPTLLWSMRTYNGGTQVVVFAKADTNEDVEYLPLDDVDGEVVDANEVLGFPTGRVDTMRLYKNDRLLNKDGAIASISSNGSALWGALATSEDLKLSVDGTPLTNLVGGTYTFTDDDFVDAETGFTTLGVNTPEAWAAVFEMRIPGITATVVNGAITLTSNKGRSSNASLTVTGGSLVTKSMFSYPAGQAILESTGADSDYTLDRNTGEFKLTTVLEAGDKLAAGSEWTRAFLESEELETTTLANDGWLWFAVDGEATVVPHALTASTPVDWSSSLSPWGARVRITQTSGTGMFSNVLVGDWLTFWSTVAPAAVQFKSVRVSAISTNGSWVEFDWSAAILPGNPFTFTDAGITFSRTTAQLQAVTVPAAANYTASSFQPLVDVLTGARAEVYQTTKLRVRTNTFEAETGDIALVAANVEGLLLGIETGDAVDSLSGHLASVEAGNDDSGTPDFRSAMVTADFGNGEYNFDWELDDLFLAPQSDSMLVGLRPFPGGRTTALTRYGQGRGIVSSVEEFIDNGGSNYQTNAARVFSDKVLADDRLYIARPYALQPSDELAVVIDDDTETKRYVVPMARTLKTVGTTFGVTNDFKDADNGNASLAVAFGFGSNSFDFNDFAVYMAARNKTHAQGDAVHYTVAPADATRTVLWRYYRLGPEGNYARVRYVLPTDANQAVAVTTDILSDNNLTGIDIRLASGALKTGYALTAAHKVGYIVTASAAGVSSTTFLLGFASSSATRDGAGNVTVTVPLTGTGATDHGWVIGNSLYFKNNHASFPDGVYAVTAKTATTVTYNDGGGAVGATGITGTVSYGTTEATLTGASPAVAVGDFFRVEAASGLASAVEGMTMRIDTLPDPQTIRGALPATLGVNTVTTWATLGDLSAFKIFVNSAQTASTIRTSVNALSGAPITGTLIGSGAGVIDKASYAEAASTTNQWFSLVDGVNYVSATTVPGTIAGDYTLTFKEATDADLATNSDWANEVVKIVPRTTANVVDWLNVLAVSGLSSTATVERSSRGGKPQIASQTIGSDGSVQIQGGGANSATATVLGAAVLTTDSSNNRPVTTVLTEGTAAFLSGGWYSVDNTETLPKNVFNSATVLNSIAADGSNWRLVFAGGTPTYTVTGAGGTDLLVSVERQGDFVAITDTDLGGALTLGTAAEGDWVRFVRPTSPTYYGQAGSEAVEQFNTGNVGIFRVVRVGQDTAGRVTVWIENSAAVEQALTEASLKFFSYDSVMPGDVLHISTSLWDGAASNQGVFTVVKVGDAGGGEFTSTTALTVSGTMSAVGSPRPALGTSLGLVQMVEAAPSRLIKQLFTAAPNQTASTQTDLKFTTQQGYTRITAAAGSVIKALDKLAFPTTIAKGIDGYQHNTGLIAEVSRVIYGDPSDTATYPGVAAAGARVNIQGPLVKRVQVTLAVRLRTGASAQDVEDRVKSAVAAVINKAGTGQSIALNDLTGAASKVGGVVSVVMVSPVATVGSDLISVQPFEKPLVLNVDQDVLVTFVGD